MALRQLLGGWAFSETAFFYTRLPFTVLSQPYTANNKGIFQGSGPQFARRVPGVPLYRKAATPGVTVEAGVPGVSIPARFGTLQSTVSPPAGLLGVGLGGDSSPRMVAFQARIEF